MKRIQTILLFVLLLPMTSYSQSQSQYFDGADTSAFNSIFVDIDTSSTNVWQIGPPQKIIFDSAATVPNVLITDTLNTYPPNNTSSFQFTVQPQSNVGIHAFRWKQKLDMDSSMDGGIIEFSVDSGTTWLNAFDDPHVYNFYGFDTTNVDTLANGVKVFTGTDTVWRDIWLCYDISWLSFSDSITVRYTFLSDSIDNNREGWMIDNLISHGTFVHTINEKAKEVYMTVSPNPTKGRINIDTRKQNSFHIIENIQLVNLQGRTVQRWENCPTKFYLDIAHHPPGVYFLNVKTNVQSQKFKIILEN